MPWEPSTPAVEALRATLAIKCPRPDRLLEAAARFVRIVFNMDMSEQSVYDLGLLVVDEVPPAMSLAMVSVTGYDASYKVENLIKNTGTRSSVAVGSQEGFTLADQAIAAAARQRTWVLLKNVHLAPSWLGQLEKKLQTLNPHRNFRLYLTMEANPSISVNILHESRLVTNVPPPGVKANLLDSLRGMSTSRLSRGPAEKVQLYFLLAWFHAVVQERLRYLESVSKARANIDPASILWDALRILVKQSVYGGRVYGDFDQRILDSFVDNLLSLNAYNVDFHLELSDREPSSWLSLSPTAERVIAIAQGNELLGKLRKMRMLSDDDDEVAPSAPKHSPRNSLLGCERYWIVAENGWQHFLRYSTPLLLVRVKIKILYRLFSRGGAIGCKLLSQVKNDLGDVVKVCLGGLK
ncbi:dynein heavy chain [Marasmius tenuissimus]|uniref:Dynein heavy chain n=1 Tax=Marasmius tenuissimus TaxID=585030 RepID=A0ABR2ZQT2_9AGAR